MTIEQAQQLILERQSVAFQMIGLAFRTSSTPGHLDAFGHSLMVQEFEKVEKFIQKIERELGDAIE